MTGRPRLLVFCVICLILGEGFTADENSTPVPEEQVTPESSPKGNGHEQTVSILITLLRNLNKTEDGIEAVRQSIHELVQNIDPGIPVGEEKLNILTSKHKKYSLVPFFKETWNGALEYCKDRGMELASIENENDQKNLNAFIYKLGYYVFPLWIAAPDITTEIVFDWGRKQISYLNGDGDKNCSVMEPSNLDYISRSCDTYYSFACQYFSKIPNQ